jgi:bifunctional ADP-heptose synthase (sugar kinase/adenylyltransferase)
MVQIERLQFFLHVFPKLTIALVGDLFLDRYLQIDANLSELSLETGLEAHQVTCVRNQPGALGTVLNNLAALGAGNLVPVTVIGDDGHGYDLLQALGPLPVDTAHVIRSPDRLTPTYTKPLRRDAAGAWQELNRLDVRSRQPLSDEMCDQLCRHLQAAFARADGLIVLDQIDQRNAGVIHDRVRDCLRELSQNHPDRLMYIDSRRWLPLFDFGTLKGNRAEMLAAVSGTTDVRTALRQLNARTGRPVFCTVGDDGVLVVCSDGRTVHVHGYPVDGPVDIVGAGDSATSGMVLSLLAGATETEAAAVGNLVASITVQQLGTTGTATPQQVLDRWYETCT